MAIGPIESERLAWWLTAQPAPHRSASHRTASHRTAETGRIGCSPNPPSPLSLWLCLSDCAAAYSPVPVGESVHTWPHGDYFTADYVYLWCEQQACAHSIAAPRCATNEQ